MGTAVPGHYDGERHGVAARYEEFAMEDRRSPAPMIGAILLLFVAPLIAYVAGYFFVSKRQTFLSQSSPTTTQEVRFFRYEWAELIYSPIVTAESLWLGEPVHKMTPPIEWDTF
jgi:hypothetical protein